MLQLSISLGKFPKDLGNTGLNFYKTWKITQYKAFELQISKFKASEVFSLNIDLHWYGQDHAGPEFTVNVLGWMFTCKLYDTRHWDYEKGSWVAKL